MDAPDQKAPKDMTLSELAVEAGQLQGKIIAYSCSPHFQRLNEGVSVEVFQGRFTALEAEINRRESVAKAKGLIN